MTAVAPCRDALAAALAETRALTIRDFRDAAEVLRQAATDGQAEARAQWKLPGANHADQREAAARGSALRRIADLIEAIGHA